MRRCRSTELAEAPSSRERRATYRLQLHAGFDLHAAAELVDYLAELGVSHVYASPLLERVPGSSHGYDVIDPRRVSAELGGGAGLAGLHRALARRGMGLLADVVPNHMATDPGNRWWWDVLENGPASRFAAFFDVDWRSPEPRLRKRVLLPILEHHYGRVLASGGLRVERAGGAFRVRHREHLLPVAPRSLDALLRAAAARSGSLELAKIAEALAQLPPVAAARDFREGESAPPVRALERLLASSLEAARAVDRELVALNADPARLDALLERQSWRAARWQVAGREISYRRFFDLPQLVALRVEDARVFEQTHALPLAWLRDGVADGLRIDHVDGLREPRRHLERLRAAAPGAWLVVEKILQPEERLPRDWPVHGSTGYDFMNRVLGLFVDPEGEKALTNLWEAFCGREADWEACVREQKTRVLEDALAADLERLTALAVSLCERHWQLRDHTRHELREALRAAIACFPSCRSYAEESRPPSGQDARAIAEACRVARLTRPDLEPVLFQLLEVILLRRLRGPLAAELALRFQQLCASAHARGVEDTAFYTFTRFVAQNEVGGAPGSFGTSPGAFHAACRETLSLSPHTLLATQTHDTKRGEDVRARLALLSEIPERWAQAVGQLRALAERHRRDGRPDRGIEYLLYQTLVGAWPIESARVLAYLQKAAREAKTHTSWARPDAAYESALLAFAQGVLEDPRFRRELESFVAPLVLPGRVNSLAQTLIKLTAPGVADLYQGCELWDTSLVDPDNRRAVDYGLRRRLLHELAGLSGRACWARHESGLPKLWTIQRALALRRRRPDLFAGSHHELAACGERAAHVLAFARGGGALVVVPRLVLGVQEGWGRTQLALPAGEWCNRLDDDRIHRERVALAELLAGFPVALLERVS
jgi:(1->4)-alpha-D-glucan 1-alpha-D-glucosylmutase